MGFNSGLKGLNFDIEFFEILRYVHKIRGRLELFLTGQVSVYLPCTVNKMHVLLDT